MKGVLAPPPPSTNLQDCRQSIAQRQLILQQYWIDKLLYMVCCKPVNFIEKSQIAKILDLTTIKRRSDSFPSFH